MILEFFWRRVFCLFAHSYRDCINNERWLNGRLCVRCGYIRRLK